MKTYILDFNVIIKQPRKNLQDIVLNQSVCEQILYLNKISPMDIPKLHKISEEIEKDGIVELQFNELNMLKKYLKEIPFFLFVKVVINELFENAIENAKEIKSENK